MWRPGSRLSKRRVAGDYPRRFVSILYDDVHISMEDAVTARRRNDPLVLARSPQPTVWASTPHRGQNTLEFTSDHESLKNTALNGIIPRSMFRPRFRSGGLSPTSATTRARPDRKTENDQQAMAVRKPPKTVDCAFNGDQSKTAQGQRDSSVCGWRAPLSSGDEESEYAYRPH